MASYKNLTLLHSNDMHGDFLSEKIDDNLTGGISMLSGYISKVKAEVPNTLYCISGDMLQGSLIDAEYRGISTIEIMNRLSPDVVTLGNHEIDYGLGHLLLLERCAKFPIVNANLYIKSPYTRLFKSHLILTVDGMKIMFIGIITGEVLASLKKDSVLGSLVDVKDAAKEVGRICNAYRTTDIDFTILLTHIGFESDKELAALLDPEWGVDVIIGGHSHTILEQPEEVNGILITQAGVGTDQIGRFDITIDTDENKVYEYKWELIPIDDSHCPRDEDIERTIASYKEQVDEKYEQLLCRFPRALTHPNRYQETELGNLIADILQETTKVDIMMVGSGSIRKEKVGPLFTRRELLEMMPYDDKLFQYKISGRQFKRMYQYMLRDEALKESVTEFYQFSRGIAVEYDPNTKMFNRFDFYGVPMDDNTIFTVGLQEYHQSNFTEFFNLPIEEVEANGKPIVLTTSLLDVLEEYFGSSNILNAYVEKRLIIL